MDRKALPGMSGGPWILTNNGEVNGVQTVNIPRVFWGGGGNQCEYRAESLHFNAELLKPLNLMC